MLKVEIWPDVRYSLKWPRLIHSKNQPGLANEIKRVYSYEPIVYRDGLIHIPRVFEGGMNLVLVEKANFVAVWGYSEVANRFSPTGYGLTRWFRYYYERETRFDPVPIREASAAKAKRQLQLPDIQKLSWNQLGSRLQSEITARWREIAPGWMQEPERIAKYRPGLIVSGKTGKTASITAADIVASDPTAIELGEVELLTGRISDTDILL